MPAFSLLIITNVYNDLDQPYGSLSCDPHTVKSCWEITIQL